MTPSARPGSERTAYIKTIAAQVPELESSKCVECSSGGASPSDK